MSGSRTAVAAGPEVFAEDLGQFSHTIQPKAGFTDVLMHADSGAFYVEHGGQLVELSQRQVASLLEARGVEGSLRLVSCDAGQAALAQNLANKMGVTVEAASNKVWLIEGTTQGPYIQLPGEWKTFLPGRRP